MVLPEALSLPLKAVPLGKVASPQAMTEGIIIGSACFLRKRRRCGEGSAWRKRAEPSPSLLRKSTSPERGRFCSTYRKMPKSSPFGGAGRDQRERAERVCSREYPLSLCYTKPAPPRGRLLVLPQSFPPPLKPSPWGRWLRPTGADGRGHSLVTMPYKTAKQS